MYASIAVFLMTGRRQYSCSKIEFTIRQALRTPAAYSYRTLQRRATACTRIPTPPCTTGARQQPSSRPARHSRTHGSRLGRRLRTAALCSAEQLQSELHARDRVCGPTISAEYSSPETAWHPSADAVTTARASCSRSAERLPRGAVPKLWQQRPGARRVQQRCAYQSAAAHARPARRLQLAWAHLTSSIHGQDTPPPPNRHKVGCTSSRRSTTLRASTRHASSVLAASAQLAHAGERERTRELERSAERPANAPPPPLTAQPAAARLPRPEEDLVAVHRGVRTPCSGCHAPSAPPAWLGA